MYAYLYFPAVLGPHKLHSTILWLGDISEVDYTPADILGELVAYQKPGCIRILGLDLFGPNKNIPVAVLQKDSLVQGVNFLRDNLLNKFGCKSASEYTTYNPHVTLPPEFKATDKLPEFVYLSNPELRWNHETYTI